MDRVEQMYAQQYGQPPNDQPHHVSAEVRDAFVKIHLVLKAASHDDEAATAILELLIKKSLKKTPKKPSALPDDSSGNTSPIEPDSAAEPALKQTVTFIRKSSCRFGESCQYQYLNSGYDASNSINSHERPAKSEPKFPPILSSEQKVKLESYFDKTTEIFGSPEVDKLLHDVSRLASELPVLTEAKQKPFPQVRSSMIPKSLVSGPEWSSKGDKGLPQRNSKGLKGEKDFGGGSVDFGFRYDSGSNYGSNSKGSNYGGSSYGKGSGKGFPGRGPQFEKDNSGRCKGYSTYSREGDRCKGNSFLSAAEAEPFAPPPDWFHQPPSFISGPDPAQGNVNVSQQAMNMLLSQSQPLQPSYSDGSFDRMQSYAPNRSSYVPQGAPLDETSGKTFWSHGSQYNGSIDGKGGSWFGGHQYRGAGVPGKGGPHDGGYNFSC